MSHVRSARAANWGAVAFSVGAVVAAGMIVLSQVAPGPVSLLMIKHIVLMNVLAPVAALPLARHVGSLRFRWLVLLASLQMILLWAGHAPALAQALSESIPAQISMLTLLGLVSTLFWCAVLASASANRWGAVACLLVTGKLACLLGGLLVFAPREIYGLPGAFLLLCTTGPSSLEDQQLAGLLMITACPLSYVTAGVALAAASLGPFNDQTDDVLPLTSKPLR